MSVISPKGNPRVTEDIGRGMLSILYSEIQFIALYSFASLSVAEVEKWWTKNSVGCGSCLCVTVNGVSRGLFLLRARLFTVP